MSRYGTHAKWRARSNADDAGRWIRLAVLAEAARHVDSCAAHRHGISPSLVFGWRRRMTEGGKEAVQADDEVARAEIRELQKRIRELD